MPYEGVPVSTEGQEHVPSAVGPMGRSLSSIHQITKLVIEAEPWRNDPRAHNLPWREDMYQAIQSKPLVIGLLLDDGVVRCHPPIDRVVRIAAEKLEAAGHTIVPWSADGHAECIEVMVSKPISRKSTVEDAHALYRTSTIPQTAERTLSETSPLEESHSFRTCRLLSTEGLLFPSTSIGT